MVKAFTLSKRAQRAMELAANPGRAAEPGPIYAYGVLPSVATRLDPARFDVRTLVVRRDHKPLTSADVKVIEAALAAAGSRGRARRVTTARVAAARVGRLR